MNGLISGLHYSARQRGSIYLSSSVRKEARGGKNVCGGGIAGSVCVCVVAGVEGWGGRDTREKL